MAVYSTTNGFAKEPECERPRREELPFLGKMEAASSLEHRKGLEINALGYKRDFHYEQLSRTLGSVILENVSELRSWGRIIPGDLDAHGFRGGFMQATFSSKCPIRS